MSAIFTVNAPLASLAVSITTDAGGIGSATFTPPPGRWTLAAVSLQAGTLAPSARILQSGAPVGPSPADTLVVVPRDTMPGFGPLARMDGSTTYTLAVANADVSTALVFFLFFSPCGK
jgi:hypothetical protein